MTERSDTALALAALRLVRDDPDAARDSTGEMRDAIIAAGMMIPPLVDVSREGNELFLTERGIRALQGQEP